MTYRIGLIGCGGRQNAHVEAFESVEQCEIVAVADLNQKICREKRHSTGLYFDQRDD